MSRPSVKILVAAMAVSVLAGCATTREVSEVERRTKPVVMERYQRIATPEYAPSTFQVDNGFYAARTPLMTTPINPQLRLPESFFKDANMNIQTPTSLMEIAARISRSSGYQVHVDQDVLEGSGGGASSAAAPTPVASSDPSAPPSSLPPLPAPTFAPTPVSVGNDLMLNEVLFTGNLSGLLDAVTARLNLSWRWTGSRVEVYRYETKMFRLNALAGQTDVSSNLDTTSSMGGSSGGSSGGAGGAGGSSGGTEGSSGQSVSMSSSMEIWKEVEEAVKGVMTDNGKISMTPSAGTITVRDTPAALRQVESQITEFNRIYGRQVTMNVEVYAIEQLKTDSASINWNLVWGTAADRAGIDVESTPTFNGSPGAFTLGVNGGPFNGSSVVASVLSTVGKTTLLTSVPVTTLNGQTVPVNISRDRAYVASVSSTVNGSDSGGGTTSTITPGVVSEGFSMNVMPRILEDNNVVIRYAVDLATIEGISTFTTPNGEASVQLPQRATRNFLQNVKVKSGQTLVLTGFQQVTGGMDGQGPGSPSAWFLGGNKSASSGNRTIVIVITPYVLRD